MGRCGRRMIREPEDLLALQRMLGSRVEEPGATMRDKIRYPWVCHCRNGAQGFLLHECGDVRRGSLRSRLEPANSTGSGERASRLRAGRGGTGVFSERQPRAGVRGPLNLQPVGSILLCRLGCGDQSTIGRSEPNRAREAGPLGAGRPSVLHARCGDSPSSDERGCRS